MKIKYKVKRGKALTPCPHGMKRNGKIINVQSSNCMFCDHYVKKIFKNQIICNHAEQIEGVVK